MELLNLIIASSDPGHSNMTKYNNSVSDRIGFFENDSNVSELPLDMQFNDGHRMAILMYLVLMIISAIGNVYVLLSIMRIRRKKRKFGRINLLLLNLAVADLVVTFIMMPVEIGWNITVSWLAGDFICRLLAFFRTFGLYLSGFVLICICMDRYYAIMKPLENFEADRRNKKWLIGAWIASIVGSVPQSFIFHVEHHPDFQWYEQCVTFNTFPSPEYELAYSMFGFCLMYAIPMLSIIYCYSFILCKMYSIAREKRTENSLRRSCSSSIQRAKIKTLKMTIITALAFFVCWTPYNVICLWYWFDKSSAMKLDQRLQKGLFVFACTNSCLNPVIYGWYRPRGNGIETQSTFRATGNRNGLHRLEYLERLPQQPVNVSESKGFVRTQQVNCNKVPSSRTQKDVIMLPLCNKSFVSKHKSLTIFSEESIDKAASASLHRSESCSKNYFHCNGNAMRFLGDESTRTSRLKGMARPNTFDGNSSRKSHKWEIEITSFSC